MNHSGRVDRKIQVNIEAKIIIVIIPTLAEKTYTSILIFIQARSLTSSHLRTYIRPPTIILLVELCIVNFNIHVHLFLANAVLSSSNIFQTFIYGVLLLFFISGSVILLNLKVHLLTWGYSSELLHHFR